MDCSENPIIDDDVQQNECSDASEFNVENLLNLPGNYFFFWGGRVLLRFWFSKLVRDSKINVISFIVNRSRRGKRLIEIEMIVIILYLFAPFRFYSVELFEHFNYGR